MMAIVDGVEYTIGEFGDDGTVEVIEWAGGEPVKTTIVEWQEGDTIGDAIDKARRDP